MMGMPQPVSASETVAVSTVSALPERILNAAAELIGQQGPQKTTMAEIARAAGVGKGTAYLYWSSKEELLLALLAHELLRWVLAVRDKMVRDPEDLCPSRLGVLLLDSWPRELVELIASDLYLRRILAAHQGSREALERSMPMKLCLRVLPLLRQKGLARDDVDALEQAYVFDAVMTGFEYIWARWWTVLILRLSIHGSCFRVSFEPCWSHLCRLGDPTVNECCQRSSRYSIMPLPS